MGGELAFGETDLLVRGRAQRPVLGVPQQDRHQGVEQHDDPGEHERCRVAGDGGEPGGLGEQR